jgi:D-alanyl-D-alanine carboxypeptidase/D-alanyl-D-alanine-endopeptidase (penicillin-binding protein 4)
MTASAGGLPASAQAIDAPTLRSKLRNEAALLGPAVGIYVRDLDSGRTLFERKPDLRLMPASNTKLMTTSAALLRLGPDATLRTSVLATAAPVDGVIRGDVVLVGGGDPYLTPAQIQSLADQITALGIRSIHGRVLADSGMFDNQIGVRAGGFSLDEELGGRLGGLVVGAGRGKDPGLYAARLLHEALRHAHIKLSGLPRAGAAPAGGIEIAGHDSARLAAMIGAINVPSDNFGAEMLLKVLGATAGAGGTTTAGLSVVRSALATAVGIHPQVFDGSGLSRANRVTARQLVRLLTWMRAQPTSAVFEASLPTAGHTGTLKRRMRGGPASHSCRAKTGTLRGVSSLAGYCLSASGRTIAFAFIENRICTSCAKRSEDRMTNAIARYTG